MDAMVSRWRLGPIPRRWLFPGLVALLALPCLQYTLKIQSGGRDGRSAFLRWTPQLTQLSHGADIWRTYNYPNPPIMALILMPFAANPGNTGALAWFFFKAALTAAAIACILGLLDRPQRPFPWWGKALAVTLSLRPIYGDLTHGNVNLFIFFLVAAALLAFTRRRDFAAGVLLALAIACKLTPALFVPYFAWKRAWRTLAGTGAGLCLFWLVVPSWAFGWERNWTYLQSWHDVMVHPFLAEGMVTSEHQNQSLPGVLTRLLTRSPSFSTYEGDRYVPVEYDNWLDLDRDVVGWLVKCCMALYAAVVAWRCRAPVHGGETGAECDRADWRLWAEFGVVLLGMLIFSERTWKHHAVTMVIPFTVLCYALAALDLTQSRRRWIIVALTASSLLMLSTSTGFWSAHDVVGKSAQVHGAYLVAFVTLTTVLFVAMGWRSGQANLDGAA